MKDELVIANMEMGLAEAFRSSHFKTHRIILVDDAQCVKGIVSQSDAIQIIARSRHKEILQKINTPVRMVRTFCQENWVIWCLVLTAKTLCDSDVMLVLDL